MAPAGAGQTLSKKIIESMPRKPLFPQADYYKLLRNSTEWGKPEGTENDEALRAKCKPNQCWGLMWKRTSLQGTLEWKAVSCDRLYI